MAQLILLGGPPGVGKTTVLRLLDGRLPRTALLDADDVRRISPDLAPSIAPNYGVKNVIAVLRGYFTAGCERCLVAWVFARPQLYEPVIAGVADLIDSYNQIYLVASGETLAARLTARKEGELIPYAHDRRALIDRLPYDKIDTTGLTPTAVADQLVKIIVAR